MWLFGATMNTGVWLACVGSVLCLLLAAVLGMSGFADAAIVLAGVAGASFVSGIVVVLFALTMDALFD
jgi:hypothetical protein